MTQEEMIEMAKKCGWDNPAINMSPLYEFAKLVAEHEREACIAHAMTSAEKAIDVAIKLEREACAEMCEEYFERVMASRIRARGQE